MKRQYEALFSGDCTEMTSGTKSELLRESFWTGLLVFCHVLTPHYVLGPIEPLQ